MSSKFDDLGNAENFSTWCFNLEYKEIPNEVIDKIKFINNFIWDFFIF